MELDIRSVRLPVHPKTLRQVPDLSSILNVQFLAVESRTDGSESLDQQVTEFDFI